MTGRRYSTQLPARRPDEGTMTLPRRSSLFLALALAILAVLTGCSAAAPLPPKAIDLNRDGAAALAAGDLETAEARLALALEYHSRFTEAWVNLGLLEMKRGQADKAKKAMGKALGLNPDLPMPHYALGLLAEERVDHVEAEKRYRAALKVDPGFAPARANLGRLLFARAAWDDAREQFLRLTEVEPGTLEGWLGLTETLLRLEREDEADRVLARARPRFGDVPEIAILVARQMLRRGAYQEAEAILAEVTEGEDKRLRGSAWSFIGVARLARGKKEEATQAAREALSLDPRDEVSAYVIAKAKELPRRASR